MNHQYAPFTTAAFFAETGLAAAENEAVYLRWVNTQINYANFREMQAMNNLLREILGLLKTDNPAALPT